MNIKVTSTCRVCDALFYGTPLLHYSNMPAAAQHLPDADSLAHEKGVDLDVCQCSGCGLVQLSNPPVPYYKDVIRAAAYSPEMKKFRLSQFTEFVTTHNLVGKKVLEIGCGKGEFLSLMEQCGADTYGVEHAAESVEVCTKVGLKVTQGYVETGSSPLADAPFDAFFMLNFLEHLPDLNSVLRGIGENLNEHAVGLVEVPNFDMILEKRLFSEFISDHLYYFTQETLAATLNRNGFEVLNCTVVWHDYILSALVRKRGPLDVANFAHWQDQLTQKLHHFISDSGANRVAVWGAGHQALAVLALAELTDKVVYVIDSAPFKQGRFTPATHIPIVSPEKLITDPVDAVIVMAASYSDEVAITMCRDFGVGAKIAILRDYGLEFL